jgi:hypothetical protein
LADDEQDVPRTTERLELRMRLTLLVTPLMAARVAGVGGQPPRQTPRQTPAILLEAVDGVPQSHIMVATVTNDTDSTQDRRLTHHCLEEGQNGPWRCMARQAFKLGG